MKGYYKKSDGRSIELKQEDVLSLCYMDIVELVIPDGCEWIDCSDNQLKELIIPAGCKVVNCSNNQLTKLIIPDGCKSKSVSCYNNQLKELILPNSCDTISCWGNQLKVLVIPDGCREVWADMKSVTELNKVNILNLWI